MFTDPAAIAAALFTLDDFAYVVWLGIPLAGAFLLAPGLAVIALPQLVVNTLADSSPTTDPRTHYIAAIVPFLVAASVFGLARLPSAHRLPAAGFLLALCSGLSLLVGQWLAIAGDQVARIPSRSPRAPPDGHAERCGRSFPTVRR